MRTPSSVCRWHVGATTARLASGLRRLAASTAADAALLLIVGAPLFSMAKVDVLFPVADDAGSLAGFFRKQANQAAQAGLEPHRRAQTLRLALAAMQITLAIGLLVLTLVPLNHTTSTWLLRSVAALVIVTVVVGMRSAAGLDYKATGFHLRLWTLCERCGEMLAQKTDPKRVHGYYLQHRALLEKTLKGTQLIN